MRVGRGCNGGGAIHPGGATREGGYTQTPLQIDGYSFFKRIYLIEITNIYKGQSFKKVIIIIMK